VNVRLAIGVVIVAFSVPVRAEEVVLAKVRSIYPDLVAQWENDCLSGSIDTSVFDRADGGKFANAICWYPPEADGSRTGQWLGIAPLNLHRTFRATCHNGDRSCQEALTQWRSIDPQAVSRAEIYCASKQGTLFVVSRDGVTEIRCGFFATTVWDENSDGSIDDEDPVSVETPLGTLN